MKLPQTLLTLAVAVLILGAVSPIAAQDQSYDPERRLAELGIELPQAPSPVANYVNGVQTGNLIFLAGKGPKRPDGSEVHGKLGDDLTIEEGYEAARLTAINQLAVLKAMLGDLSRVKTGRQGPWNGQFRSGLRRTTRRDQRLLGSHRRGLRGTRAARAGRLWEWPPCRGVRPWRSSWLSRFHPPRSRTRPQAMIHWSLPISVLRVGESRMER